MIVNTHNPDVAKNGPVGPYSAIPHPTSNGARIETARPPDHDPEILCHEATCGRTHW